MEKPVPALTEVYDYLQCEKYAVQELGMEYYPVAQAVWSAAIESGEVSNGSIIYLPEVGQVEFPDPDKVETYLNYIHDTFGGGYMTQFLVSW